LYESALQKFKIQYEYAMAKMDIVLTNSINVQKRITKYLGIKSNILYPPCEVEQYYRAPSQGYFLSTARHDPLKQVGMVLEAFALLPAHRLVIISNGPESRVLQRRANKLSNVEFIGRVDDGQYRKLLSECTATIYIPSDEDFGLSPVESMAAGKPVIGTAQGGLLETIVPGKTGILIPPENLTPDTLATAITDMANSSALFTKDRCTSVASQFSYWNFRDQLRAAVASSAG
jgi:glycosyltransferase involved in cell wall biosynthesis